MENYFKSKKLLLLLFFISFIIFLVSALLSCRIALGDGPCEFFKEMILYNNNPFDIILNYNDNVVRFWSFKLHRIFFYIFFPFFSTIKQLSILYSFSLIVTPFILLISNYYIAKRTKRFDITVLAFLYYCLFEIPYISHLTREYHITTMLLFLFFSYYFTKEKLKKFDFFIIFLLSIFLFESGENIVILGSLLFILGLLSFKKNKINNKKSLYMGIVSIIFATYTLTKTILNNQNDPIMTFENSIPRWIHNIQMLPEALLTTCMIFSIIGIITCILLFFIKRELNKKDLLWEIPLVLFSLILVYINTNFIADPNKESNLFILFLFVPTIIFIGLWIIDYFEIKIDNYYWKNILTVGLIIGMLQFIWQTKSSILCYEYTNKIKNQLNSSKGLIIVHFDEEEKGYTYDTNICYMFRGFILSDEYKIKSTLIPDPLHRDYTGNENYGTYYDKEMNKLKILDCPLSLKNRYWDITEISKYVEEKYQ